MGGGGGGGGRGKIHTTMYCVGVWFRSRRNETEWNIVNVSMARIYCRPMTLNILSFAIIITIIIIFFMIACKIGLSIYAALISSWYVHVYTINSCSYIHHVYSVFPLMSNSLIYRP